MKYPLLLFPTFSDASRTKRKSGWPSSWHFPSPERQISRIKPIWTRLVDAFAQHHVSLTDSTSDITVEKVLVLETIGSVDGFYRAVEKIPGLEWLNSEDAVTEDPDDDFFDEEDEEKKIFATVYMTMTNAAALRQMMSLWNAYEADPTNFSFPPGQGRFGELFAHLKSIRYWEAQDRLTATGVLDGWRRELSENELEIFPCEIGLWFRNRAEDRAAAESVITSLVTSAQGTVESTCTIPEIRYHAVLAKIPRAVIQQIVSGEYAEFVKADPVMFFQHVGQKLPGRNSDQVELQSTDMRENVNQGALSDPVVALLDGLPLQNHERLSGALIVDDPDNFENGYAPAIRVHGTEMASLILNGDLGASSNPSKHRLYVRPILKPNHNNEEAAPEDCLFVDVVHRAVVKMLDATGSNSPAAPTVKIINFSIGDPYFQFVRLPSPLAKLLDWLSFKYKVLFVVSAGNHTGDIKVNCSMSQFEGMNNEEREKCLACALYEDSSNRRLLSPAETINGITVGALHDDAYNGPPTGSAVLDPLNKGSFAPYTALGLGFNRSVKPDIVMSGGRLLYRVSPEGATARIACAFSRLSPGILVATPSKVAGETNKCCYSRGTSDAAALASRSAANCFDALKELFETHGMAEDFEEYAAVLIKGMLIHGATQGDMANRLKNVMADGQESKPAISRFLGYGCPREDFVAYCTDDRATVIGYGALKKEEAHVYRLPIPAELLSRPGLRRITVTLAWLSPISVSTQTYRVANLWVDAIGKALNLERSENTENGARRGTVQHEIFVGTKTASLPGEDPHVELKVNYRPMLKSKDVTDAVSYSLFVTIEAAESLQINVYNEVKNRLLTPIVPRPVAPVP